jgi:hypothetical protein
VEALSKSMSAAPVETLSMRRRDTGTEPSQQSAGLRRLHCLCSTLFPQSSLRGVGKLPLDYIACMALLGFLSAVLGFTMDLGIERLHRLRRMGMELIEGAQRARPYKPDSRPKPKPTKPKSKPTSA